MSGIGGTAREAPDATAIVSMGRSVTFAELDERQRRLAGALHEQVLGVGDRIAVLTSNRVESLEVTIGALRAGIVPVPINPLLTPSEVDFLLEDSGTRWLFTDRPLELADDDISVITFGDAYERMLFEAEPAKIADHVRGRPMHYTSGSTGRPKGVWVAPVDEERAEQVSREFREMWGLSSDDVHLVCSPLAHSAPHRFAMRTLEAGGTVALIKRFEAREALAAIELFGVTSTFMVPTHLERILAVGRELGGFDLSSIGLLAHAGAPIRPNTKKRVLELFPEGCVWEFYGSTEGPATRISTEEWRRKPGSVGTPKHGARISITDEKGRTLPTGETGEIWIEDPEIERFEYWGDPVKTHQSWRKGAYSVADLGYLDEDGYLYLTGRKFDTIITSGVNVYPQEVERVLTEHPGITEAIVFGVPNNEWGQEVRARVVAAEGESLDAGDLRAWARERLAGFKCPRTIEIVSSLPKGPTGKILRPKPD
jgi:long-chain acyl-CoA synthetase